MCNKIADKFENKSSNQITKNKNKRHKKEYPQHLTAPERNWLEIFK